MISKLHDLIYSKSKDRAHVTISQGEVITPHEAYVVVKLRSVRIVNVRKGWTKFYPCVYSYFSLKHETEGEKEIASVVRPSKLGELDLTNLEKVIVHDRTIVDGVAFRGGAIEAQLGVCAVKSSSLAGPYLELLDEIAGATGAGIFEVARPFVGVIGRGVELLLGSSDDVALEVGLHAELEAREGVYAIIDEAKEKIKSMKFGVDKSDGKLITDKGLAYTDASYCVYEIKVGREKHNWREIPLIKETFDRMNVALQHNQINEAEEEMKTFKRLCILSPDLIRSDADRLIRILNEKLTAVEQIDLSGEEVETPLGSLDDIKLYPH